MLKRSALLQCMAEAVEEELAEGMVLVDARRSFPALTNRRQRMPEDLTMRQECVSASEESTSLDRLLQIEER